MRKLRDSDIDCGFILKLHVSGDACTFRRIGFKWRNNRNRADGIFATWGLYTSGVANSKAYGEEIQLKADVCHFEQVSQQAKTISANDDWATTWEVRIRRSGSSMGEAGVEAFIIGRAFTPVEVESQCA